MKRTLFTIIFLPVAIFVSAQFNLGVKAGYNSSLTLSNITSLSEGSYTMGNVKSEMWNNFQAGAFARVFVKKFYLQPEVLYSMQKREFDILDVMINGHPKNVETYMNISTVQVPLYLGFKLLDLKVANLRVFAGPKFILNSGSQLEYKNIEEGDDLSAAQLAEEFKSSQIDIEAGVGVDLFMLALDAKLNVMQDVAGKIKNVSDLTNVPMPTSTLVISLSWKIF